MLEGWPTLGEAELETMLQEVTARAPHRLQSFRETGELDTSYMAPDLARFRVNGFKQRGATSFAFRVIPIEIPRFEDLHLPLGVQKGQVGGRGPWARDSPKMLRTFGDSKLTSLRTELRRRSRSTSPFELVK